METSSKTHTTPTLGAQSHLHSVGKNVDALENDQGTRGVRRALSKLGFKLEKKERKEMGIYMATTFMEII
jgi:hypothetical protein